MKVLILGNGAREHAIAWKLKKSTKVNEIYCCPGNAGTQDIVNNINIDLTDFEALSNFVKKSNIHLTITGSELPLSEGIVDFFQAHNLVIFGPTKLASEIESSKVFAKNLMKKYGIPTAEFMTFCDDEYDKIISYIKLQKMPIVIKADGLAAGKGVLICNSTEEAERSITDIVKNKSFGNAGRKIVIEEYMEGEEASLFAVTDGRNFITLPSAQDHKRIFDGDKGKNTGGMGAYAPTHLITTELLNEISGRIINPVLLGLSLEGRPFRGCLYCGLMLTKDGPKVVEFNCRFGDPETQVVLPLIRSDFYDLLYKSASGDLSDYKIDFYNSTAVCIVLSSKGYPDKYESGNEIKGLDSFKKENDSVVVFHAGTTKKDEKYFTSGGRVLSVTAICEGDDLAGTINSVYASVDKIYFEGAHFRKDIGKKGLNNG